MCLLRDRQTRDSVRHMNFTDETLTSYLGRIPPPRVIKTESSQAEKQSEAKRGSDPERKTRREEHRGRRDGERGEQRSSRERQ